MSTCTCIRTWDLSTCTCTCTCTCSLDTRTRTCTCAIGTWYISDCNSVLALAPNTINDLLWVLNASTRLISCASKYDRGLSLSAVLHDELHWLNIPRRLQGCNFGLKSGVLGLPPIPDYPRHPGFETLCPASRVNPDFGQDPALAAHIVNLLQWYRHSAGTSHSITVLALALASDFIILVPICL